MFMFILLNSVPVFHFLFLSFFCTRCVYSLLYRKYILIFMLFIFLEIFKDCKLLWWLNCNQRPPVIKGHIFVPMTELQKWKCFRIDHLLSKKNYMYCVFKERFDCTGKLSELVCLCKKRRHNSSAHFALNSISSFVLSICWGGEVFFCSSVITICVATRKNVLFKISV